MRIISFIKTKKYIVTLLINFLLLIIFGISISSLINEVFHAYQTFNNCESTYVAYDTRKFEKNYYYYYKNDIDILLKKNNILINAEVYQFINEVIYDNYSLLSSKNIALGSYSNLNNYEIAIPERIANKYKITINDSLFINKQTEYKIKYIFKDLYDIKHPSIYETDNVIFVGGDIPINSNYIYAGFSNATASYNEIYTFSKAKKNLVNTLFLYIGLIVLLDVFVETCIALLYKKEEAKNLYKDLISGSKSLYYNSLFIINFMLHVLPSSISFLLLIIIGDTIAGTTIVITTLLFTMLKIIILKLKVH